MGGFSQGDYTSHRFAEAPVRDAVWQALADAFDMTTDELTTELASGKTVAEITEAKDIDCTELLALLQTIHEDTLAQAVADGTLTQYQADAILERISDRFELMIDRSGGAFNIMSARGCLSGGTFNSRGSKGQLNNSECPNGYEPGTGNQQVEP